MIAVFIVELNFLNRSRISLAANSRGDQIAKSFPIFTQGLSRAMSRSPGGPGVVIWTDPHFLGPPGPYFFINIDFFQTKLLAKCWYLIYLNVFNQN